MQLPEVHVIDTEPVERPVQLLAGGLGGAFASLGRDKEIPRLSLQPRLDTQLRVAVRGGGVDVIDAKSEEYVQGPVSDILAYSR